jgi:hypothetical protein
MKKVSKKVFIEMVKKQAFDLLNDNDRRRRLDGRLQLATIEIVKEILPDYVVYKETPNGRISQGYLNLNVNYRNLHLFNNNTIAIQRDDLLYKYTTIVVIKATIQNVYRVLTSDIVNKRLTLKELLSIPSLKEYKTIKESLGL